jgi:hypothetical protein
VEQDAVISVTPVIARSDSDEAIENSETHTGLLRFARNDS